MDEKHRNTRVDKNKINNFYFQKRKLFLTCFLYTFVFYSVFLRKHYATDTYYAYFHSNNADTYRGQGRLVSWAIAQLFNNLNINTTEQQAFFTILFFICISLSASLLISKILQMIPYEGKPMIVCIIGIACMMCYVNVYVVEWMVFTETILFWGLEILFCTLSILVFYGKGSVFKRMGISTLLLLVSTFFYQTCLGYFVIITLTLCLVENEFKCNKVIFTKAACALGVGGISSVLYLIIFELTRFWGWRPTSSREVGLSMEVISYNIKFILTHQKDIWIGGNNLLPRYSMFIFLLFLIVILGYVLLKKKDAKIFLTTIFFLGIGYGSIFAPQVFNSNIWLAARVLTAIFAMFSCIILMIVAVSNCERIIKTVLTIITIFVCLNLFQINIVASDIFISNNLDREYALLIYQEIERYEKKTGITVTKIGADNDVYPTYFYSAVTKPRDSLNLRAFVRPWSNTNIISYYSGRKFQSVAIDDDIYNNYFKDKNWENFNQNEQMFFVDDTLYMVHY